MKKSLNIRLIPVVLFAATSLLTLKAFDMILGFESAPSARASGTPAPEVKEEPKPVNRLEEQPVERPKENIKLGEAAKSGETSLNERLGERRKELDARTKELDLREDLLKTSEKKLDDKLTQVKKTEASGSPNALEAEVTLQMKGLVTMYETMKPKNAAEIFNKLDLQIMVEVVSRMNPKLTSEIMAKMTPEQAQKLTVELARRSLGQFAASAPAANAAKLAPPGPRELPRIDQKKP